MIWWMMMMVVGVDDNGWWWYYDYCGGGYDENYCDMIWWWYWLLELVIMDEGISWMSATAARILKWTSIFCHDKEEWDDKKFYHYCFEDEYDDKNCVFCCNDTQNKSESDFTLMSRAKVFFLPIYRYIEVKFLHHTAVTFSYSSS